MPISGPETLLRNIEYLALSFLILSCFLSLSRSLSCFVELFDQCVSHCLFSIFVPLINLYCYIYMLFYYIFLLYLWFPRIVLFFVVLYDSVYHIIIVLMFVFSIA